MPALTKLRTLALTLLITGAIDSIRNLPASALFGSTLIFFFIFSGVVFLVPSALVSAELSANAGGGIYQWARLAYGEKIGFLAIWLQWINNVVWFPTMLSFIAGTAAYLVNPELAQNRFYLIGVILVSFWTLTFINLKGVRLSAKFTTFCAITGLIIPITFIIILMCVWLVLDKPLQIHLTLTTIFPNLHRSENWFALTAIMLSFCGMELATVHIKDVEKPSKTFPKALAYSTVLILVTMILGSLAIAFVLPANKINLVNGTIETFVYFLSVYHLSPLTPVLVLLLIIGSLGGIISWIISPIKGLSQAAQHGFLPPFFQKINTYGVPQNLLFSQAILVSLICLVFLLFPSVNGSYWLLMALSTQLYMAMYVIMFFAALRLRKSMPLKSEAFRIPGGKIGLWSVCLFGLFGCVVTLIVGFIPPNAFDIGSAFYYEALFCLGIIFMLLPSIYFYRYRYKKTPQSMLNEPSVNEITEAE